MKILHEFWLILLLYLPNCEAQMKILPAYTRITTITTAHAVMSLKDFRKSKQSNLVYSIWGYPSLKIPLTCLLLPLYLLFSFAQYPGLKVKSFPRGNHLWPLTLVTKFHQCPSQKRKKLQNLLHLPSRLLENIVCPFVII